MRRNARVALGAWLFPLMLGFATVANAVDGQILINQARALAGGVTPGDTPGFPVTVSQPGSYVLSSNLVVPAGLDGILITTAHVSLDLNGFEIRGPGGETSTFGVQAQFQDDITVVNGTVRGMGNGVALGKYCRIERVGAFGNTNIGLSGAESCTVTGNIATANSLGLQAVLGTVSGNVASRNGVGIFVTGPCNLIGNTATFNSTDDIVHFAGCSDVNNVTGP